MFLRYRENKVDFQILKFKDLTGKVIPLFQRVPLQGVKSIDFTDFNKAVARPAGVLRSASRDNENKKTFN